MEREGKDKATGMFSFCDEEGKEAEDPGRSEAARAGKEGFMNAHIQVYSDTYVMMQALGRVPVFSPIFVVVLRSIILRIHISSLPSGHLPSKALLSKTTLLLRSSLFLWLTII